MGTRTTTALLTFALGIAACAPPTSSATTETVHYGGETCNLGNVFSIMQGSVTGTVESVKTGIAGLPWDVPERQHALATITVNSVGGQREFAESGSRLPEIEPGQLLELIVYDDIGTTPWKDFEDVASTEAEAFFGLFGFGMPETDQEGRWFVRRFGVDTGRGFSFTGFCGEELDSQFKALATTLNREPGQSLALELAAEILANYDSLTEVGPLEQTLIDQTS